MRILYLHQYFCTPEMAGGTRSYEMSKRFAKSGHDVHVITSDTSGCGGRGWRQDTIDGVTVHWTPVRYSNGMTFRRRLVAFMQFAFRAKRRAVQLGGDVVFATSTPLTIAIPGVGAARRLGIPMVFEVRDLWPAVPIAVGAIRNPFVAQLANWLESYAYRNARHIVALSPGAADKIRASGKYSGEVSVVPNGCDLDTFLTQGSGRFANEVFPFLRGRRCVLYAGTLGQVNGVRYLVNIAAEMRRINDNAVFVVVGDGRERDAIRQEAERCGVWESSFWMLPEMPKRQVADVFAASDIVTSLVIDNPAMWDNSANKFFDGLAAGKCIAINHKGWLADLIEATGSGVVLPPSNAKHAAELLDAVLRKPGKIEECGRASRRLAETRFCRDDLAKQLLAAIECALK